jgi:hypothetical protein
MKIADKDWSRMMDLVLSGKDGARTAKVIKDKDKAVCRFVAGLKLDNDALTPSKIGRYFYGSFKEFGNRALELGATMDEIKDTYCENIVPKAYIDMMAKMGNKKLRDRFVGDLSRKVLAAGFDIAYLPHTGNAITQIGKDAMERNGRKWTIGYKCEITKNLSRKVKLVFDAITDEGDGPTSYVFVPEESDTVFNCYSPWRSLGKTAFIANVMETLKKV